MTTPLIHPTPRFDTDILIVGAGPTGLTLAVALATVWADDRVHAGIATLALEGARREPRTWSDVARETRGIYAAVGRRPDPGR